MPARSSNVQQEQFLSSPVSFFLFFWSSQTSSTSSLSVCVSASMWTHIHPPPVPATLSLLDMLWWRDKLKVILREQRLRSGMCGMTLSCSEDKKHIRGRHGVIWVCVITNGQYESGSDDSNWESMQGDTQSQHLLTSPHYIMLLCEQCNINWTGSQNTKIIPKLS